MPQNTATDRQLFATEEAKETEKIAVTQRLLGRARLNIKKLKPYSSARLHTSAEELQSSILLNANENPYMPPCQLRSQSAQHWDSTGYNYYPQPQPQELLQALAALYAVDLDQLIVGRGSDEGIDLLIRAFCSEQDAIAICSPTFGMYRSYAEIQGCRIIDVPLQIVEQDRRPCHAKLLNAALALAELRKVLEAPQTPKLLFIPSPLAPLGSLIPQAELLELLQLCAANDVLLVVDEAYAEFAQILAQAQETEYHSLIPLLADYPNLVILRTLSKAYSLAGERIGSLLAGPELIQLLRPIQAPYPLPCSISRYVSSLLQDENALQIMQQHIIELCAEQRKLFDFLQDLPYVEQLFNSAANFIMLQVESKLCQHLLQHCRKYGLILRDFSRNGQANLTGAFRISLGNAQQMVTLRKALESFPAVAVSSFSSHSTARNSNPGNKILESLPRSAFDTK